LSLYYTIVLFKITDHRKIYKAFILPNPSFGGEVTVKNKKEADNTGKRFLALDKQLKGAFNTIKEEFEDHLDAINENTNEIQANYEHSCEIDTKIDKLSARIDEMHIMIKQLLNEKIKNLYDIELTSEEKKVFLVLYTFGEESSLSFNDIARKANMTELLVRKAISSLARKGIPLVEEIIDDQFFYKLDPEFKQLQAKQNVLRIEVQD
jgi:hypothetical protein